jgi:hypothetical protein
VSQQPGFIELVDTEILATSGHGKVVRAPGYAILEDRNVETGDAALAQAWLYPQRSFNQFWRQLTLAPLPANHRQARHFADLAFAQLKALHRELDAPEEVVFILPGSFSKDQLSILLGLANALPVQTVAMVDSAVASASLCASQGDILHLDLHLHQAVISHLKADDNIVRITVDTIPDVGLTSFHRIWAQWIADQFINHYRYDPLHLAETEQQLYNLLPDWLSAIARHGQHTAELATENGNFQVNLTRSELLSLVRAKSQRLQQALDKFPASSQRLASYRLNKLPGLAPLLGLTVLDEYQSIAGCQASLPSYSGQGTVPYVTELPAQPSATSRTPSTGNDRDPASASHVLFRDRAYAIGDGLGISVTDTGLDISRNRHADLWLAFTGQRLQARAQVPMEGLIPDHADNLKAGDSLRLRDEELRLIEVKAEP